MVGMGSLVTKSVPDFALVVGQPAVQVGSVCRCGQVIVRFPPGQPPGYQRLQVRGVRAAATSSPPAASGSCRIDPVLRASWAAASSASNWRRKLRAAGHAVTVFEAAPQLGGLAAAWQLGPVTWDRHYHVVLLSDLNTQATARRPGASRATSSASRRRPASTPTVKLYSMSNSVEFLRFPPLGLVSKLRLGGTIFLASRIKDWKRLERIPVADWLRKWSGAGRRRSASGCRCCGRSSARATGETSAAFIWATIARMYAARRSGLKKEMFGYVLGGYARDPRPLRRGANVTPG